MKVTLNIYFITYVLCLHLHLLCAEITNKELDRISPLMVYNAEGYLTSYPMECSKLLDEFAEVSANFTKCSIIHSRPIRLCQKCIDEYVNFHEKYEDLIRTVVNGTSCKSIFISHDRFDIVLQYHDSILATWNKGNCNGCFDWSKGTPELSNNTKQFYQKFNETMECITNNINPTTNSTEVCERCMQDYLQLNKFYNSIASDFIGLDVICMDIVDSMNATRSIWSKDLNCCKLRRTPEVIFLVCTGIITMLPLLFYVVVRFCGPMRDLPNVLKQSRFKQKILRSWSGHVN